MSRTTDRRGGRDGSPRVVVVDDSPFMRGLIGDLLSDAGVAVVGEAGDGEEALSVVAETRPDVVTMDVEMPGMGGLEAVERLMEETPTPVLMLSAHTDEGAEVTFEALDRGAVDFFAKPGGEVSTGVSRESERLVEAVRSVADADLDAATRERDDPSAAASRSSESGGDAGAGAADVDGPLTVVIAASTGGPNAVERVLSALPMADCRVVVVQHMPEAFTSRFADRLDAASAYDVREASDGARIGAGEAIVARGGSHTRIDSYRAGRLRIRLDEDDDSHTVTPAADVTMRSAAEVIDDPLVGVVLTGMGSDAAEGIRAMADAGARTLAQSEDTCVIYGMPKRAVETGGVDAVYDLDDVAGAIVGGEA
ncbi:chemotaxis-specific protein-glutamate methyltransferase CheB [Halorubrum sp. T3]|uniref:chemotaxis-specific protein-glutamate methyltransferase CheB n=1 Tax=Halorubrum sp. T3 TaxID=1194088 RepID=UPI00036936C1|nr:chemotaxis-specific protein-glutamate methyltransferase CheB [Halorubrum sp. T3]